MNAFPASGQAADHTLLPWRLVKNSEDQYTDTSEWCDTVIEGDGLVLAHVNSDVLGMAEANAELIVRAVNCHDDLLAACKALLSYAAREVGVPIEECRGEPFALARSAIAKAETK